MQDLGRIFIEILFYGAFVGSAVCLESSRCDVVLKKFFVYNVHDSRNKRFDIFGARYQGFDVPWFV
jgi:hypothetical protein